MAPSKVRTMAAYNEPWEAKQPKCTTFLERDASGIEPSPIV